MIISTKLLSIMREDTVNVFENDVATSLKRNASPAIETEGVETSSDTVKDRVRISPLLARAGLAFDETKEALTTDGFIRSGYMIVQKAEDKKSGTIDRTTISLTQCDGTAISRVGNQGYNVTG